MIECSMDLLRLRFEDSYRKVSSKMKRYDRNSDGFPEAMAVRVTGRLVRGGDRRAREQDTRRNVKSDALRLPFSVLDPRPV
ncbi:hypothetical protein J6590_052591 [Homalodisca vitripennis]|nr:hypothetical protein J6590_052591 [Homalodisca vitripennis]